MRARIGRLVILLVIVVQTTQGAVRVNEFSAASSTRLLSFADDGKPSLGTTLPWHAPGFDASGWSTAASPLNWDDTTGLEGQMWNITPSLYVRREFVATAGQANSGQDLDLDVDIDYGFVAYLNGVEVARRNLGPVDAFVAFDHLAYNGGASSGAQSRDLGPASDHLVEGVNVLAIQVHTYRLTKSISVAADLAISGGGDLVTMTDNLQHFVGLTEPSGGVFDLLTPELDGDINHEDWIELYNDGGAAVDLSGWGLSDNPQSPLKWTFPSGTSIPANGFLVVMADGSGAVGNYLHTTFSLAASGEAVVLSNASGVLQHSLNPFPEQDYFHTYGWTPGGVWKHLDLGTPGNANVAAGEGDFVAKPDVSVSGGFFDSAVTVLLATTTPGATIRYTTDGSEPTDSNGSVYSGGLTFSSPTALRARAFLAGSLPSEIVTQTYLVYDPAGSLAFLRDNPAVSITGNDSRTVYDDNGISSEGGGGLDEVYALRLLRGRFTERQANLEFHFPGNPAGSAIGSGAGIRFAGSTNSRNVADSSMLDQSPWPFEFNTRPSMNFFFRDDYGVKDIPGQNLIPESSVSKQTTMRLRAGKNDTDTFTKDEIIRRAMADMGYPSVVGNFVNLWVSGEYKGMFNLTERYRKDYFQEFYDTTDGFDVISSGALEADSGDLVAWNAMRDYYANNDLTVLANYETFSTMVDIDEFIDFILTIAYAVNVDWGNNNWAFARRRSPDGKFMGLVWDAEATFREFAMDPETFNMYDQSDLDVSETGGDNPSGEIFTALRNSPEFKLRFADRMAEHLFHGGALTEASWVQRQAAARAQIEETWEFLKDRDYGDSTLLSWFSKRKTGLLVSGEEEGFWSQTDPSIMPLPPEFGQHGGTISAGFDLTITNPNSGSSSEVYYTLDETDPRLSGGALAGSAQLYTAPIDLDGFTGVVSARALVDGDWGPIQDAVFISPTPPPLRITELMYHPADPSPAEQALGYLSGDDFEYIELRNVSVSSLDISAYAFTAGVVFDFATASTTILGPGQRVVLVRNLGAFEERNGTGLPVIGTYTGGFKNSTEQVLLLGPGDVPVLDFIYSDAWYPTTDGDGFSLEIIDDTAATATWGMAASWQPSGSVGGSPGTGPSGAVLPPAGTIVINEILTHSDGAEGDWIELHNTSSGSVDIGGWFLSDDPGTPLKYEIAASTVVAANGYVVFNARDHFGPDPAEPGMLVPFGLSEKGDEVVLSSGSGGSQTGYQEQESFKGADNGVTLGRHFLSDLSVVFTTLESPTQGTANSGPLVGPIVITEINYNPDFGGYEYIKILNAGTTVVPFYDVAVPANTWQMTNGVDYAFPIGISLDPGAHLMLVPFDPDLSPADLSEFVVSYQIATGVDVLGPYIGGLSNAGERVSLSKTGTPDPLPPNEIPLIVVDSVKYDDVAPWPTGADGLGETLVRIDSTVIGDEPTNWQGVVTRVPPGSNADLAGLILNPGSLSPNFDVGTVSYSANVAYANSSVQVTPTLPDPLAMIEVRVNGGGFSTVNSGATSNALPLNEGANTVDVKVTGGNGTTTKTYSTVVTRMAPSNNADLADLELSAGSLSPTFDPSTADYTAAVQNSTSSMTVTATVDGPEASLEIRVNGGSYVSVGSGGESPVLALDVGDNPVDIRVTAQNGSTLVYTVVVSRSANDNANLVDLSLSVGSLSPSFDGATIAYDVSVESAVTSVTITPSAAETTSTLEVRVNGGGFVAVSSGSASESLDLNVGDNEIDIRVTAEDGTSTKTYGVTVNRAASGNADLAGLIVSAGSLSPEFDVEIEDYGVAVPGDVSSMTVTATANDPTSTLEVRVNGASYTPITSGVPSGPLTLDTGGNVIDVRATTAGSATQRVYTVTVTRILRVNTLVDEDDGIDVGGVSLREAIEESGAMIDFDSSLNGGTIVLTEGRLTIEKSVAIDGSSLPNGISVSGNDVSRVIKIRAGHTVSLNRVSVRDGRTETSNGAGIENDGILTLVDLELSGNAAVNGRGGGIKNEGTLTMERVAVVGNIGNRGGGLYNAGSFPVAVVINSTFADNLSNRGGGVSQRGGEMQLINVTVSSNTVATNDGGGGIYMTASLFLENTIVAGNNAVDEPDIRNNGGTITSAGSNVIGVNESVESEFPASNLVGTVSSPVQPGLAPVGAYGGLTRSMALVDGSLGIDSGLVTTQTPTFDQRGMARVFGAGLDLGAYEAGEMAAGFQSWIAGQLPQGSDLSPGGDYDGDGLSNLREYGILSDPADATADPQHGEMVTDGSSGLDHLLMMFPHRLDAADLVFEVRAASHITELEDGGDHTVVYRFEDGATTLGSGLVSRDDSVSPSVAEVMDLQSTTSNERRFLQLRTILK